MPKEANGIHLYADLPRARKEPDSVQGSRPHPDWGTRRPQRVADAAAAGALRVEKDFRGRHQFVGEGIGRTREETAGISLAAKVDDYVRERRLQRREKARFYRRPVPVLPHVLQIKA